VSVGLKLWSTWYSSNTSHWPGEKGRENGLSETLLHGLFAAT